MHRHISVEFTSKNYVETRVCKKTQALKETKQRESVSSFKDSYSYHCKTNRQQCSSRAALKGNLRAKNSGILS